MLHINQIKRYSILKEWFGSALGLALADEFCRQLNTVQDLVKGDTLLQIGHCGSNSWLNTLSFRNKWIASPFPDPEIDLECSFNQLPLDRNSLDCIILPLTLEPFGPEYNLIDEIDRILRPSGHLILFSINPWGLWGGAARLGKLPCLNNLDMKLRSPLQLNNILMQRGYTQSALKSFFYIPPVNNPILLKKLLFLNEVGKMLWPFPSGLYCYIAQKQEYIHPPLIGASFKPAINEL